MGGPRKLYVLFNYEEIKKSNNNIVLLGEVGAGKTTLFNKLVGGDFKTGSNCTSITNEVVICSSLDYKNIIFDFPGFKALDDIVPIFKVQYKTLRNIPIRTICFIIERRDRPELIVDSLIGLKETFDDYANNIIIIITKTDNMTDVEKNNTKKYIFTKTSFEKIIFTDLYTDIRYILNLINDYKQDMKVLEEVKPKSREFLKYFKKTTDDTMKIKKKEFIEEFEDTLDVFNEEFNKPSTDKALKRALYFALKDYKNNLIERYYEVAKREQDYSEYVLEHVLSFSNEIYHDFDEFRVKAEKEMDVILTNYKGETNRFKKCPYCGLIWFKITGCDGKTRCGNRDTIKDKFFGFYKDYIVKYENKKLNIIKTDVNQKDQGNSNEFNGLTQDEIQKNNTRSNEGKHLIEPVGCGRYIIWREMEDVTDEINEKLKNIPNSDYDIKFREIMKKEEKEQFQNEISELESMK